MDESLNTVTISSIICNIVIEEYKFNRPNEPTCALLRHRHQIATSASPSPPTSPLPPSFLVPLVVYRSSTPYSPRLKPRCRRLADRPPLPADVAKARPSMPVSPRHARRVRHLASRTLARDHPLLDTHFTVYRIVLLFRLALICTSLSTLVKPPANPCAPPPFTVFYSSASTASRYRA